MFHIDSYYNVQFLNKDETLAQRWLTVDPPSTCWLNSKPTLAQRLISAGLAWLLQATVLRYYCV